MKVTCHFSVRPGNNRIYLVLKIKPGVDMFSQEWLTQGALSNFQAAALVKIFIGLGCGICNTDKVLWCVCVSVSLCDPGTPPPLTLPSALVDPVLWWPK